MKTKKTSLFTFVLLMLLALPGFAATKVVKVNGMVCAFCAQGIEKKFKEREEVAAVKVSLKEKTLSLDFKEGKKIEDDEIEKILKEAGYAVVKQ
jgi:mercuric ion binding protein